MQSETDTRVGPDSAVKETERSSVGEMKGRPSGEKDHWIRKTWVLENSMEPPME